MKFEIGDSVEVIDCPSLRTWSGYRVAIGHKGIINYYNPDDGVYFLEDKNEHGINYEAEMFKRISMNEVPIEQIERYLEKRKEQEMKKTEEIVIQKKDFSKLEVSILPKNNEKNIFSFAVIKLENNTGDKLYLKSSIPAVEKAIKELRKMNGE